MKVSIKILGALFLGLSLFSANTWAYEEIPISPSEDDSSGTSSQEDPNKSLREAARNARDRAVVLSVAAGGAAAYFGYHCIQGNVGACAIAALALSTSMQTAQYANQETLKLNIDQPEERNPQGGGSPAYCENIHGCDDGSDNSGSRATFAENERRNQRTQEMLGGAGYGVDKNGNIKTPKGTFTPGQMSGSTLSSLGVTPELQAEFRAKMQEEIARASAQRENSAVAEGSGGGGPVRVYRSQSEDSEWSQNPAPQRGIASVDGLSVRRGDDLIGIQSADIFDMVHKRYQQLRQQNTFKE